MPRLTTVLAALTALLVTAAPVGAAPAGVAPAGAASYDQVAISGQDVVASTPPRPGGPAALTVNGQAVPLGTARRGPALDYDLLAAPGRVAYSGYAAPNGDIRTTAWIGPATGPFALEDCGPGSRQLGSIRAVATDAVAAWACGRASSPVILTDSGQRIEPPQAGDVLSLNETLAAWLVPAGTPGQTEATVVVGDRATSAERFRIRGLESISSGVTYDMAADGSGVLSIPGLGCTGARFAPTLYSVRRITAAGASETIGCSAVPAQEDGGRVTLVDELGTLKVLAPDDSVSTVGGPVRDAALAGGTLAWLATSCAGEEIRTAPVTALPGGGPSGRLSCPVQLPRKLRRSRRGVVKLLVRCPQGCRDVVIDYGVEDENGTLDDTAPTFSVPAGGSRKVRLRNVARGDFSIDLQAYGRPPRGRSYTIR